MQYKSVLFFLILMWSLQSCATVLGSRTNTLVFDTSMQQQAEVFLDGKKIGTAPGKIKLDARRIQHGSIIRVEAPGYKNLEYQVMRRPNAGYIVLNLVATAGVGMAVDYGTGYIYRPNPRKIVYDLQKSQ